MTTKFAPAKWAQRADTIFLRFEIIDSANVQIEIKETSITFKCTDAKDTEYSNSIEWYKEINVEDSGYQIKGRSIDCLLYKKDLKNMSYWPRITKNKEKLRWLSVDFNRWRDEDDSEDESPDNFNQDFDFSKLMNGAGGLNTDGAGGAAFDPSNINMDDIDSDDEDMPELNVNGGEEKNEEAEKEGCKKNCC